MDRYERNIKQIEDAGKCPRKYFLIKALEETAEFNQVLCKLLVGLDVEENIEKLYDEIPDINNIVAYLSKLFDLDTMRIATEQLKKLQVGYEKQNKYITHDNMDGYTQPCKLEDERGVE